MLDFERHNVWEQNLSDYIESVRDVPFEYGKHDCCCFISGSIEAMTGIDPMSEFRGQYDSLKSSIKALRDIGLGNLENTLDSKFPEIAIGNAGRGDLALFEDSVGVVAGSFAWFVSDDGLERVPMEYWQKAWRVG